MPKTNKIVDVFVFDGNNISINDLAKKINISASEIIKFLFLHRKMIANINFILNEHIIEDVCTNFGIVFKKEIKESKNSNYVFKNKQIFSKRAPVVTIMGHIDHGKTTLIDAIRNSNVAEKEAGGISQTIGAYRKNFNGNWITFIDTPGHEAFSKIRKNGAKIADIIIILVAADDGVKQQTVEAIKYAKETNANIIVAINKIDKKDINIDKVKNELAKFEIISDEYGGENIFCEISAKQKKGIEKLLENIILLSELLEFKADINNISGIVLESKIDKNIGIITTILVQNGILENGFFITVNNIFYGKVKRILDDNNKIISKAEPSAPVQVIGFKKILSAGENCIFFKNKKDVEYMISADEEKPIFFSNIINKSYNNENNSKKHALNLIIIANSISMLEAIKKNISNVKVDGTEINIIRAEVGIISDNILDLAILSNAIIFAFDIKENFILKNKIKENKIKIYYHNIIYSLIDDVKLLLKKIAEPKQIEIITGHLKIKKIFTFEKTNIAGCCAVDGFIKAKSKIRLIRDNNVIYTGVLQSLKHQKDDIAIVKKGSECGTIIKNFNDIKINDIIEGFEIKKEEFN